jgi:hypothetical protein
VPAVGQGTKPVKIKVRKPKPAPAPSTAPVSGDRPQDRGMDRAEAYKKTPAYGKTLRKVYAAQPVEQRRKIVRETSAQPSNPTRREVLAVHKRRHAIDASELGRYGYLHRAVAVEPVSTDVDTPPDPQHGPTFDTFAVARPSAALAGQVPGVIRLVGKVIGVPAHAIGSYVDTVAHGNYGGMEVVPARRTSSSAWALTPRRWPSPRPARSPTWWTPASIIRRSCRASSPPRTWSFTTIPSRASATTRCKRR